MLNLSLKIKNVHMCQRIVGPVDDDCERLCSVMVKTNKRNEDKVNSGRILFKCFAGSL